MQKVTLGLLALVIVALGWIYYDNQQQLQLAQAKTTILEEQVAQLQQDITGLQQQVETLGNSSAIEGIVRQANNAILDGWESLVTGVEKELQKARQQAGETRGNNAGQPAQPVPPAVEPQ